MERFIDELKQGVRYNKTGGWRRRRHYPPGQSKLPPRMSTMEWQQLWVKINLLESHLLLYCPHEYIPEKDMTTGKFLKQKVNPLTLDFLAQQAWGMGKMCLSRFRKQMDEAEAMLDSENPAALLVVPELCNKNKEPREVIEPISVINSPQFGKQVYTVEYL
jgi:hypothetical protein